MIYLPPSTAAGLHWLGTRPGSGVYLDVPDDLWAKAAGGDPGARDAVNAAIPADQARKVPMRDPVPARASVPAAPAPELPAEVAPIAADAQHGDRGLGDTLKRYIDKVGGGTLAEWYTRITGRDCKCGDRQAKLNALFPYPQG